MFIDSWVGWSGSTNCVTGFISEAQRMKGFDLSTLTTLSHPGIGWHFFLPNTGGALKNTQLVGGTRDYACVTCIFG